MRAVVGKTAAVGRCKATLDASAAERTALEKRLLAEEKAFQEATDAQKGAEQQVASVREELAKPSSGPIGEG